MIDKLNKPEVGHISQVGERINWFQKKINSVYEGRHFKLIIKNPNIDASILSDTQTKKGASHLNFREATKFVQELMESGIDNFKHGGITLTLEQKKEILENYKITVSEIKDKIAGKTNVIAKFFFGIQLKKAAKEIGNLDESIKRLHTEIENRRADKEAINEIHQEYSNSDIAGALASRSKVVAKVQKNILLLEDIIKEKEEIFEKLNSGKLSDTQIDELEEMLSELKSNYDLTHDDLTKRFLQPLTNDVHKLTKSLENGDVAYKFLMKSALTNEEKLKLKRIKMSFFEESEYCSVLKRSKGYQEKSARDRQDFLEKKGLEWCENNSEFKEWAQNSHYIVKESGDDYKSAMDNENISVENKENLTPNQFIFALHKQDILFVEGRTGNQVGVRDQLELLQTKNLAVTLNLKHAAPFKLSEKIAHFENMLQVDFHYLEKHMFSNIEKEKVLKYIAEGMNRIVNLMDKLSDDYSVRLIDVDRDRALQESYNRSMNMANQLLAAMDYINDNGSDKFTEVPPVIAQLGLTDDTHKTYHHLLEKLQFNANALKAENANLVAILKSAEEVKNTMDQLLLLPGMKTAFQMVFNNITKEIKDKQEKSIPAEVIVFENMAKEADRLRTLIENGDKKEQAKLIMLQKQASKLKQNTSILKIDQEKKPLSLDRARHIATIYDHYKSIMKKKN